MPCWVPLVYLQLSMILNLRSADSCAHTSLSVACIRKNIPDKNALVSLTTSTFRFWTLSWWLMWVSTSNKSFCYLRSTTACLVSLFPEASDMILSVANARKSWTLIVLAIVVPTKVNPVVKEFPSQMYKSDKSLVDQFGTRWSLMWV